MMSILLLLACSDIVDVGKPFVGYDAPDYLWIEEVDATAAASTEVIPHPQETVFNLQTFYGGIVSGNSIEAYA